MNGIVGVGGILAVCSVAAAESATQAPDLSASNPPPKQTISPRVPEGEETALQERRTDLFQRMLDRPDDLDAAFEYANLSIQVGDMEAAISTLERMLVFTPNMPRLQLELGLLYYRLSAYRTARSYFESAISGPDVPQSVMEKVDRYLSQIARATRATQHSGLLRVGLGYQTNANQAPEGNTIVLNGLPFQLDLASRKSSDSSLLVSGNYRALVKLARQDMSLTYGLSGSISKQSDRGELDFASLGGTVGPLFELDSLGYEDATLKVYATTAMAWLDQYRYSTYLGAGTEIGLRPNVRSSGTVRMEFSDKSFENSPTVPRAGDREGIVAQLLTNWQFLVDSTRSFNAAAEVTRNIARADHLNYLQYAMRAGHALSLKPRFGTPDKWTWSNSLTLVGRKHDIADRFINASAVQKDTEYVLQSSLLIPLDHGLSFLGEANYRRVNSNYSTREHDNFNTTLSIVKVW